MYIPTYTDRPSITYFRTSVQISDSFRLRLPPQEKPGNLWHDRLAWKSGRGRGGGGGGGGGGKKISQGICMSAYMPFNLIPCQQVSHIDNSPPYFLGSPYPEHKNGTGLLLSAR